MLTGTQKIVTQHMVSVYKDVTLAIKVWHLQAEQKVGQKKRSRSSAVFFESLIEYSDCRWLSVHLCYDKVLQSTMDRI
jgi:hypothetical protein